MPAQNWVFSDGFVPENGKGGGGGGNRLLRVFMRPYEEFKWEYKLNMSFPLLPCLNLFPIRPVRKAPTDVNRNRIKPCAL